MLRHGTTRTQVLGLEAVLADGSVISRMNGLPKDNSGYDLVQLLVGSEGTLGVLTRAVRLSPRPAARAAALLALEDAASAVAVARALRAVPGLDAVEFYTAAGLDLVLAAGRARAPFAEAAPVHVLAEAVGPAAEVLSEALAEALEVLPGLQDAALATSETDRARLWALREATRRCSRRWSPSSSTSRCRSPRWRRSSSGCPRSSPAWRPA